MAKSKTVRTFELEKDEMRKFIRGACAEALRDYNQPAQLPPVPRYKRIEDYTHGELDAAIIEASVQEGAPQFWKLVTGLDAFFERRRRQRGWGMVQRPAQVKDDTEARR